MGSRFAPTKAKPNWGRSGIISIPWGTVGDNAAKVGLGNPGEPWGTLGNPQGQGLSGTECLVFALLVLFVDDLLLFLLLRAKSLVMLFLFTCLPRPAGRPDFEASPL